eukprot:7380067-Prymnesium_polylepis.1
MPSGPWPTPRADRLALNVRGEECTPRSRPGPRSSTTHTMCVCYGSTGRAGTRTGRASGTRNRHGGATRGR